jgi:hypothetical protein
MVDKARTGRELQIVKPSLVIARENISIKQPSTPQRQINRAVPPTILCIKEMSNMEF